MNQTNTQSNPQNPPMAQQQPGGDASMAGLVPMMMMMMHQQPQQQGQQQGQKLTQPQVAQPQDSSSGNMPNMVPMVAMVPPQMQQNMPGMQQNMPGMQQNMPGMQQQNMPGGGQQSALGMATGLAQAAMGQHQQPIGTQAYPTMATYPNTVTPPGMQQMQPQIGHGMVKNKEYKQEGHVGDKEYKFKEGEIGKNYKGEYEVKDTHGVHQPGEIKTKVESARENYTYTENEGMNGKDYEFKKHGKGKQYKEKGHIGGDKEIKYKQEGKGRRAKKEYQEKHLVDGGNKEVTYKEEGRKRVNKKEFVEEGHLADGGTYKVTEEHRRGFGGKDKTNVDVDLHHKNPKHQEQLQHLHQHIPLHNANQIPQNLVGAGTPGAALPTAGLPGTGLPGTGLPGTGLPGAGEQLHPGAIIQQLHGPPPAMGMVGVTNDNMVVQMVRYLEPFLLSHLKIIEVPSVTLHNQPDFEYLTLSNMVMQIEKLPDRFIKIYSEKGKLLKTKHLNKINEKSRIKFEIPALSPKLNDFHFSFKRRKLGLTVVDEGRANMKLAAGFAITVIFELKRQGNVAVLGDFNIKTKIPNFNLEIIESEHRTMTQLLSKPIKREMKSAINKKIIEIGQQWKDIINREVLAGVGLLPTGEKPIIQQPVANAGAPVPLQP